MPRYAANTEVSVSGSKLEAVECAISTLEREFLADTLVPNGQTVGDQVIPALHALDTTGQLPALLPGFLDGS